MNIDPYVTAVGLIGENDLTDELLTKVLAMLRVWSPDIDDATIQGVKRQLESSKGVSHSVGQGLHGGDIAPWVLDVKASITWHYWDAYVKQLRTKNFGNEVIRVLDQDTENILTECGNPQESGPWVSKGLVMGDVQSGKTASYCGLISKAGDAGYKIIVLLTGMIEDLRAQSQERLDEGFVGRDSRKLLTKDRSDTPIGAGRFSTKRPNVLTSIDSDFLKANQAALGGIPLGNISEPVLLVMKKNVSPLSNLIEFLDSQMKKGVKQLDLPLLIVDDEADNASVNGRKDEEPAAINSLIRKLLDRFSRASYVAYTATPFANVLINPDIEKDLFPANFVYSLETPSSYLGVTSYFGDDAPHADAVQEIHDAEKLLPYTHKKDRSVTGLPESLRDALAVFLLTCAVRDGRKEPLRHRSMLVNASRFTDVQARIATLLKNELYALAEDIKQYLSSDTLWANHARLAKLHELWITHYPDVGMEWDEVRQTLYESISSVKVITVNQKSDESERLNYSLYEKSRYGRRVIAVGGLTLSRGLTLEGLCISYFYRNSKAYDTLLQMGRWFGYRPGYDDLCRIWVDPLAKGWYAHLAEVVTELRRDISRMHAQRQPPSRFGMRIRSHPDALIVTALNKMRNANEVRVAVSYSSFGAETPLLPESADRNDRNLSRVKDFTEGLSAATLKGSRMCWSGIEKSQISRFLDSLDILEINTPFMRDSATKSRPLIDFVSSSAVKELEEWDVCIPQGTGTALESLVVMAGGTSAIKVRPRTRQFERTRRNVGFLRLNKQRVGDVSDELVGFTPEMKLQAEQDWEQERARDKKLGASVPGYFYRRYRTRPLLTIHVIEPSDPKPQKAEDSEKPKKDRLKAMLAASEIEPRSLVAISISFPNFDGFEKPVYYTLNKVALREAGLLEADDNDDDED
ncbi:Z1 domain-containing protein [Acidovorax sp. ACV01]|uniref:Z1 domain-containing protein n=1 Tax=Acidovorax sp. ACV01 TaxID=2769311 RepID=UPI001783E77A|nr:Z1 domain-containing protein [Acidovorax sp. ACV01]MBD9393963.1 Z1 domain-containing protein [Acidovorax sp. ACV01]